MAARTPSPKLNNQELMLYRLDNVEKGVTELNSKFDKQENIKRSDLIEFRETIISRFNEIRDELQEDIKDLKTKKADQSQVDDLRGLVKAGAGFFTTVLAALIIYYLTRPQ